MNYCGFLQLLSTQFVATTVVVAVAFCWYMHKHADARCACCAVLCAALTWVPSWYGHTNKPTSMPLPFVRGLVLRPCKVSLGICALPLVVMGSAWWALVALDAHFEPYVCPGSCTSPYGGACVVGFRLWEWVSHHADPSSALGCLVQPCNAPLLDWCLSLSNTVSWQNLYLRHAY
jgi:hypothetical protein